MTTRTTIEIRQSDREAIEVFARRVAGVPRVHDDDGDAMPTEMIDGAVTAMTRPNRITIAPVREVMGPENCGSGPMRIAGGACAVLSEIYADVDHGYGRKATVYVAVVDGPPDFSAGKNVWWNYGHPSGTHTHVAIRWERVGRVHPIGGLSWQGNVSLG